MRRVLVGLGLLAGVAGVAARLGTTRWTRTTARQAELLRKDLPRADVRRVTFASLDQLPAPVSRYLRFALRDGQPFVRFACIRQSGALRTVVRASAPWKRFQATHHVAPRPPGFVWDARVRLTPLLWVRVRDAYVLGQASGRASLLSIVQLASDQGRPELNAGALHRYLAEAVWLPTALLPGEGVEWSPIDDRRAMATLIDGQTTVSLEFRFGSTGEVTSVYSPGRYGRFDGRYVLTPWEGHHHGYVEHDGMRIPSESEVAWHLPTGAVPVWAGRLARIRYELAG